MFDSADIDAARPIADPAVLKVVATLAEIFCPLETDP